MRRVDGEKCIPGAAIKKIGVLLLGHEAKIHVGARIAGLASSLPHKCPIPSMQLRVNDVGRNLEGNVLIGGDVEDLLYDDTGGGG